MDQPGAIVEGNYLDPFGQHRFVERLDLCFDAVEDKRGVFAFAHQNDAGDDVILVILADDALARYAIHPDFGEIFDQHGRAVALDHDDVPNVITGAQQTDAADEILLFALLDVAAARVGVAAAEGGEKLLHRDV